MLAMFMRSQVLPDHRLYAPIDAEALQKYKIFQHMGFYGVSTSIAGATEFLNRSLAILGTPGSSLWITPEGKFCDPRDAAAPLQPGLAHLAQAIERRRVDCESSDESTKSPEPRCVWFVPAAMEYPFWEERSPECLCWFGQPVAVHWGHAQPRSKQTWLECFTQHLRDAQRCLAEASVARDAARFEVLLRGKGGSGSFWTRLFGKRISQEHSGLWK